MFLFSGYAICVGRLEMVKSRKEKADDLHVPPNLLSISPAIKFSSDGAPVNNGFLQLIIYYPAIRHSLNNPDGL
ncbi:MAG: hypothetical protein L0H15_08815 [Nitrosospira sp.]|nr:hypothetical protein [Nitrosospira sp.]MDN5836591.1 hypothetical protein [Nitrosospira sp.]MDN5882706.1 hypothetical protein [Nitrosospira sp.]MDN5934696.1 hypothetical protein [Nitrosospira sp.]